MSEGGRFGFYSPKNERDGSALSEDVDAESTHAFFGESEIEVALLAEESLLFFAEQYIENVVDIMAL